MGRLDIRRAGDEDLRALVGVFRQAHYFADRLLLQESGHGELLIAWLDEIAAGHVYLWMVAAEEPELREHLPDVPLITHLEVVEGKRNQGIGTALLRNAHERLWRAGHKQVALGVSLDNADADRLYTRLGYAEWKRGPVLTTAVTFRPNGDREVRPEMCRILVKNLSLE